MTYLGGDCWSEGCIPTYGSPNISRNAALDFHRFQSFCPTAWKAIWLCNQVAENLMEAGWMIGLTLWDPICLYKVYGLSHETSARLPGMRQGRPSSPHGKSSGDTRGPMFLDVFSIQLCCQMSFQLNHPAQ